MTTSGPLRMPAAKAGRISFASACAANNKPAVAATNSNTWTEVKRIYSIWAVTKPLVHLAITDYFPFVMGAGDYPKVSFIMPTLNAEAILENCLASIAQQTYPRERYEILLADAHSKDATREIARRYGAIVLRSEEHTSELQSLAYLVC